MTVGKIKIPNHGCEPSQETRIVRILKVFSLRKKFSRRRKSCSEYDTVVGLTYKRRKGWSLSDLFNGKQKNKPEEPVKVSKDESYVGPDDITPIHLMNDFIENAFTSSKKAQRRKNNDEEILKSLKQFNQF